MLKLYDSLERREKEFKPVKEKASMYYCGPTVYWTQHIGNMRAFFVMDTLRRVLEFNGLDVDAIMNITDVGHMTSDEDEGEDKMLVASTREKKTPKQIADYYTEKCLEDMKKLNIKMPTQIVNATSVIDEIIEFVQTLIKNGFAYETPRGIYYDISKYADYGKLGGMNQDEKRMGARIEVDEFKRNPADFALWVKAPKEHILKWESPWGLGYPGWHIECSAICKRALGDNVDVHGGGIEHKPVHHENEIAQNYGYYGKKVVQNWIHHEHLMVDGGKMSKSLGNVWSVSSLEEKGFMPIALRYFFLNAHYSKQQNFTLDELKGSQTALVRLYNAVLAHKDGTETVGAEEINSLRERFLVAINDNLNMPAGLAVVWEVAKNKTKSKDYYNLLLDLAHAEQYLTEEKSEEIPQSVVDLAEKRWQAKQEKRWADADELRAEILALGYVVKDKKDGYDIDRA